MVKNILEVIAVVGLIMHLFCIFGMAYSAVKKMKRYILIFMTGYLLGTVTVLLSYIIGSYNNCAINMVSEKTLFLMILVSVYLIIGCVAMKITGFTDRLLLSEDKRVPLYGKKKENSLQIEEKKRGMKK